MIHSKKYLLVYICVCMCICFHKQISTNEESICSLPTKFTGYFASLAVSIFFSPNGFERYRSSVLPLAAYSSSGEFNIAKRNCRRCAGSRPTQEGCPRCAVVSIPSAFGMIHRYRGFVVAAAARQQRQHMRLCVWLVEKCKVQQRRGTHRTRRDVRRKRKQSVRRREIMQHVQQCDI